ncbi:MAG: agmatinase family protein [Schleiferiaceae bacterium]|jgi:agmatinase
MSKEAKIAMFDPNEAALNNHLFGLPFDEDECDIHVLPAPWEVTVSYGAGTAQGPEEIRSESAQVDLYDEKFPEGWQRGIWMHEIDEGWAAKSDRLREKAEKYLEAYEREEVDAAELKLLDEINDGCGNFHRWVERKCDKIVSQDKRLILLGGDHSTSLGALRASKKKYGNFGVLQIDAHADLRPAYEGFEYSHASIMYNGLKEQLMESLTIVGLRDFCHQEAEMIGSESNIHPFTDKAMNQALFAGQTWTQVCRNIVNTLPDQVYLSVDIDGLDPSLCPNTGTPVPGGLSMAQFLFLLDAVVESGRKFIGADLVEVSPGNDAWDANVGARVLYAISHRLSE